MKKIWVLLVVLSAVMVISGCGIKTENPDVEIPENKEPEKQETQMPMNVIKSSDISDEVLEWNTVSSFEGDIDGDGHDEVVKLVTSAECDEKERFMWNDGQNWALYVTDESGHYLLYEEYVNAGYPYFEVSDYYLEDDSRTQIDFVVSTGAGLSFKGYFYSTEEQGYVENVIYDSGDVSEGGINKRHSSFPVYDK